MADHNVTANLRLKKTVVLVGMMGAGKTAVGKAMAAMLNVPFRDSDAEIENAANMTIAEIFERDGEPFFREKEGQVIERLLDGDPCVLSTGGGAFLKENNRLSIAERGVAVCLNADVELLWMRVRHKDTRPLLRTANPKQTLKDLYAARVPIYQMADLQVATNPKNSIDDTAKAVIDALKTRKDVLEDN